MSAAAPIPPSPNELVLAQRLRRMRWLAGGLLAAMGGLFAVSSLLLPRHPWLGVVRAFAEAALIGGLADWFAVTALFRRPFGLPIPHTAIVPARKDAIGRALARFIRDHFLVKEAIEQRLERADLAGRLGAWLADERNAARVSRDAAAALDWMVAAGDGAQFRSSLSASLRGAFDRLPLNTALAAVVDALTAGGHVDTLIDKLVQFGRAQLEQHRVELRVRIHERSPWWLPSAVDQKIFDQLIGETERIFGDIERDPQHPARVELKAYLQSLHTSLAAEADWAEKRRALRDAFLGHPAVRAYADELWLRAREFMHESLRTPESTLRVTLEREIRTIGTTLATHGEAAGRLNGWLKQLLPYLVENYRDPLSEIVSETIERWDAKVTAERIELHIGRDLQFIRVNGTLVGGLVGVLLYVGWGALT
jgi:uncharacterized membrane-anchored protein YjiN (DUF445 family)